MIFVQNWFHNDSAVHPRRTYESRRALFAWRWATYFRATCYWHMPICNVLLILFISWDLNLNIFEMRLALGRNVTSHWPDLLGDFLIGFFISRNRYLILVNNCGLTQLVFVFKILINELLEFCIVSKQVLLIKLQCHFFQFEWFKIPIQLPIFSGLYYFLLNFILKLLDLRRQYLSLHLIIFAPFVNYSYFRCQICLLLSIPPDLSSRPSSGPTVWNIVDHQLFLLFVFLVVRMLLLNCVGRFADLTSIPLVEPWLEVVVTVLDRVVVEGGRAHGLSPRMRCWRLQGTPHLLRHAWWAHPRALAFLVLLF